jgi:hypothetical protein
MLLRASVLMNRHWTICPRLSAGLFQAAVVFSRLPLSSLVSVDAAIFIP